MMKDSPRHRIIHAAKCRFSHFSDGKTTMAEVAGDCEMSPGNIYRFFPGKLDIAETIATEDYQKHLEHTRKIALVPSRSARERLHDLLFQELRTDHKLEKDPRAGDGAGHRAPAAAIASLMLANERKILVELLDDAERSREFVPPCDKEETAEMIQLAPAFQTGVRDFVLDPRQSSDRSLQVTGKRFGPSAKPQLPPICKKQGAPKGPLPFTKYSTSYCPGQ